MDVMEQLTGRQLPNPTSPTCKPRVTFPWLPLPRTDSPYSHPCQTHTLPASAELYPPFFHLPSPPRYLLPAFSPFSPSLTGVSHGSQGAQMKMELASLAPLQVPRVAVPRDRPGEALPTQTLYRKTTQLLETLYQLSANAKVVDMRQSKSSRSYTNIPWGSGGLCHLRVVPLPVEGPAASGLAAGWDPG